MQNLWSFKWIGRNTESFVCCDFWCHLGYVFPSLVSLNVQFKHCNVPLRGRPVSNDEPTTWLNKWWFCTIKRFHASKISKLNDGMKIIFEWVWVCVIKKRLKGSFGHVVTTNDRSDDSKGKQSFWLDELCIEEKNIQIWTFPLIFFFICDVWQMLSSRERIRKINQQT